MRSEGCCDPATHHRGGLISINGRMLVPQRFAIDWFRLDSRHRAWVGSPGRLSSYLSYRLPAIAAAAGTVVRTQDGLPNNPDIPRPPAIPAIQNTVGNKSSCGWCRACTCCTRTFSRARSAFTSANEFGAGKCSD
jgi:hypothetical protein